MHAQQMLHYSLYMKSSQATCSLSPFYHNTIAINVHKQNTLKYIKAY